MNKFNHISIKQYLEKRGITPTTEKNYYGMYISPFRNDTNPSFKVDYTQNLWYDFGTGEGGSIIDLVMKMDNCSLAEAMLKLESNDIASESFSFQRNIEPKSESTPEIKVLKALPITNPALIDYLNERKINIDIAKEHCKEIHYSVGNKEYFAIGFENNSGGYELRNKYFKGCTSKNITSVNVGSNCCHIFEGFMDYFSFLTLNDWKQPQINVVVLNSVNNLSKAMDFISSHKTVYPFLDNDESGKQALKKIEESGVMIDNQSVLYKDYKDLNDFLCKREMKPKIPILNKSNRLKM